MACATVCLAVLAVLVPPPPSARSSLSPERVQPTCTHTTQHRRLPTLPFFDSKRRQGPNLLQRSPSTGKPPRLPRLYCRRTSRGQGTTNHQPAVLQERQPCQERTVNRIKSRLIRNLTIRSLCLSPFLCSLAFPRSVATPRSRPRDHRYTTQRFSPAAHCRDSPRPSATHPSRRIHSSLSVDRISHPPESLVTSLSAAAPSQGCTSTPTPSVDPPPRSRATPVVVLSNLDCLATRPRNPPLGSDRINRELLHIDSSPQESIPICPLWLHA